MCSSLVVPALLLCVVDRSLERKRLLLLPIRIVHRRVTRNALWTASSSVGRADSTHKLVDQRVTIAVALLFHARVVHLFHAYARLT